MGTDPYDSYTTTLKWITETKAKLPDGSSFEVTSSMRDEAFNVDPLLKGTITPFLKNTILGSWHIETTDDKKFSPAIEEIKQFIQDLDLVDCFREDFIDYGIKHGHSYRRIDYEGDSEEIDQLSPLDNSTITTYRDPWDTSIVAYHQKIFINDAWSDSTTTTEHNSWFIPGGKTYIEGGLQVAGARAIWEEVKSKYNITDVTGLRVDSSDRIIAMHRVEPGEPAPIDSAVLAIWLKRLLLTNSPNIIFRVLSPFVHIKNGVLIETTVDGEKQLITSVPQQPPEDMASTDPEQYSYLNSAYNTWVKGVKSAATNIISCLKDGGVFSSGPDTSLEVVESGRTVPSDFIKTMLDILDEEIGQAFGFPVSLVKANGSELATSRTILELFNTTYARVRQDYQSVADELIRKHFEGKSWTFELEDESGEFTFEDIQCKFILDVADVKDQLKIAQAKLQDAKRLQIMKQVGASQKDIQTAAEQAGFGVLDLDNFDNVNNTPAVPFGGGSATSVQSTIEDLEPSEQDDGGLAKTLMKAYEEARAAMKGLM
ncbi:hypothetical protein V7O66_13825 [Methanolobus sp. ZRKC3]|uniref:hypothetical protein n=1 Tax=Methanolobus sp. ZRKC3 TaxID=3125786 RepID=UPI00324A6DBE